MYHHLTVKGSAAVDPNYASVEVLRAAGLPRHVIDGIVRIRAQRPLRADDGVLTTLAGTVGEIRVGLSGEPEAYHLWATARLGDGRATRAVGARVRRGAIAGPFPMHVVRWYDSPF